MTYPTEKDWQATEIGHDLVEQGWRPYPSRTPNRYGGSQSATYATEKQAEAAADSLARRYPFYETRIAHTLGPRPFRVAYRKVKA